MELRRSRGSTISTELICRSNSRRSIGRRAIRSSISRSIRRPASSSGVNVGKQESSGVELSLQGGDFSKNGLSFLAFVHVHRQPHQVRADLQRRFRARQPQRGDRAIQLVHTRVRRIGGKVDRSAAAASTPATPRRSSSIPAACTSPIRTTAARSNRSIDRNGWFTTYDVIPTAFSSANGFAVPDVATLMRQLQAQPLHASRRTHVLVGIVVRLAALVARLRAAVVHPESGAQSDRAGGELQRVVSERRRHDALARRDLPAGSVHASVRHARRTAAAVAALR